MGTGREQSTPTCECSLPVPDPTECLQAPLTSHALQCHAPFKEAVYEVGKASHISTRWDRYHINTWKDAAAPVHGDGASISEEWCPSISIVASRRGGYEAAWKRAIDRRGSMPILIFHTSIGTREWLCSLYGFE